MPAARRIAGPLTALALATAALAGCGSDSSATTTTAAAPGPPGGAPAMSAEQRRQLSQLRACLKKQGVDLPTGGPGGPGGPPGSSGGGPPQLDPAAVQACAKYLPQGGPPGMGAPPSPTS